MRIRSLSLALAFALVLSGCLSPATTETGSSPGETRQTDGASDADPPSTSGKNSTNAARPGETGTAPVPDGGEDPASAHPGEGAPPGEGSDEVPSSQEQTTKGNATSPDAGSPGEDPKCREFEEQMARMDSGRQGPGGEPVEENHPDPAFFERYRGCWRTYDLEGKGPPKVFSADFLDLDRIERVSKFRGGYGHDYNDGTESCRSMKHYFWAKGGDPRAPHSPSWTTIRLYAPAAAKVTAIRDNVQALQVVLTLDAEPSITVLLFHVTPAPGLEVGSRVAAGQWVANFGTEDAHGEIAVHVQTPNGKRYLSYFDAITEDVAARYAARGVPDVGAFIMSKAARDAAPFACNGEYFAHPSTYQARDWVELAG